jgi:predicted CopG family antitoxin
VKYKLIAVSEENWNTLKEMGKLGETFNDVVTKVLNKDKMLMEATA